MKTSKGFTIIELLVVIAIIAVLAAVVLVNVTGYINKGKDSAAKGNLATLSTAGAVYFETYGSYNRDASNSFNNSTDYYKVSNSLNAAGYNTTVSSNDSAWCASVLLKASSTNYCVDSTGNKKEGGVCASQACP